MCADQRIAGETHRYAQRLLTNAALAGVARHHRLDEDLWSWVPRTQATGVKILGTLIEAILGAIWIDCEKNLLVVRTVLERLYGFPLG
jgi:dsRNA-specific ribonuclease